MAEPKRPWPKRPSPKRPSPKRLWPKRPTFNFNTEIKLTGYFIHLILLKMLQIMRGIFLANSVQSFLNAEKYVIISKYYLWENTLL